MSVEVSMEAREIIEGLLYQFAYDTDNGKLWTGGLSALEAAFDYLGWEGPHPVDPSLICNDKECSKRATCGTPTPNGYQWLCLDPYKEVAPSLKRRK